MGLMGLTTDTAGMNLTDGVYPLYTNEKEKSVNPFFMYQDPLDANNTYNNETYGWRGVYSNNQHPQEWSIQNDFVNG